MPLAKHFHRIPWFSTAREVALFAYRRGRAVRLQQVAGSLTFTTVLSIVPLFAVALSLFTAFPLFAEFRGALNDFVFKSLPPLISTTVLRYINEFAVSAARLTAAGVIFLALAALVMIMTVDRVMNDIWEVRDRRPFGQRMLIYWALLTLGPLVIGASLTASSFLWSRSEEAIRAMPPGLHWLIDYAPVVLSGLAYAALYVFVPNRTVRWRDALIGGFVAAILAEVLKSAFAYFIVRGSIRSIYGAFAALPLFLLWMYLSWYVVLFGAAIAATLPRLWATRFSDEKRAGNGFITALALLRGLLEARRAGTPAVGVRRIAAEARTDPIDTERLLDVLERLGYVRRLAKARRRGEASEWMLTCNTESMSLRPAFEKLAIDPGNTLLVGGRVGLSAINDWLARDEWINAPLDVSLGDAAPRPDTAELAFDRALARDDADVDANADAPATK